MEQENRITLKEPCVLSKQQRDCWRVLSQELSKTALHCRQDLTEPDVMVYFESLKDRDPEAVKAAIVSCREQMDFIPKLNHILDRLSPKDKNIVMEGATIVREWDEPYSPTQNIHYTEYEGGYRQASFVRAHGR
jgi:hypothetical protein